MEGITALSQSHLKHYSRGSHEQNIIMKFLVLIFLACFPGNNRKFQAIMYPLKSHASKSRTKGVREMAKGRGKKLFFFGLSPKYGGGSRFLNQKVTKKSNMYLWGGRVSPVQDLVLRNTNFFLFKVIVVIWIVSTILAVPMVILYKVYVRINRLYHRFEQELV